MTTSSAVKKRREKVQTYLAKGILSPSKLAQVTGETVHVMKHDLKFFKKNSNTWLTGLGIDGFTFQAQNTMDQLQDMIEELQQKRSNEPQIKSNINSLIKVDNAIANLLGLQWQISCSGPTLMNIKRAQKKYEGLIQDTS